VYWEGSSPGRGAVLRKKCLDAMSKSQSEVWARGSSKTQVIVSLLAFCVERYEHSRTWRSF